MVKIGRHKKRKLSKKRILNENRGKFINFAKIGDKFINSVITGGICNMLHWLWEMDAPAEK